MTRVAAIDCGTNSTRLLVAAAGAPLVTVERQMHVTRLGAGVDETGRLDDAALERTVARIRAYHQRAVELGAQRFRVAATSAIRDAVDRDRFLDAVTAATGLSAEVLSGDAEAAATFAGATATIEGAPPYLVLDIGGGSTEAILGGDEPTASTSRQLGCVRLTERWLRSDPPTGEELDAAARVAADELDLVAETIGLAPRAPLAATLVGVAGTVTTLAALHLGLETYDAGRIHGSRLPADAVGRLVSWLAAMSSAQRGELGPMAPGREDVIVGGAVILHAAVTRLGAREVLVSEADILDGLAASLLDR